MSDDLPEHWRRGRFHEDGKPHFEHEYLDAELRVSRDDVRHDADGRELPDGERREVYRIWITHGVPFGASEMDFEAPEPITSREEAREWSQQLMEEMDARFSLEDHYYVGAAMNAVLGTDEYNDSGTVNASEDYCCPICGVPLDLFRGMGTHEQLEQHLEYADDDQHADVSLSVTSDEPGQEQQQREATETCGLCGDDAHYLHSVTSEPGLPSGMQSRLGICSGCRNALDAVDSEDCGWCGSGNASPVSVVGSSEGRYSIGWLCRECLDTESG